ncbi:MAG TPA: single-stranded DNA-binding protein [Spirochaetota bacterium]|nr:single-stranded DNA-binding protein [Spirochaetota bacterium]
MNKIMLIGRMTKDPELRYTSSSVPVANFTIAVDRSYLDKDNNKVTDFFNVIVWRKPAENVKKYCCKGSLVHVEGELQNREYDDKDGIKRRVTEILAERVEFLSTNKQNKEEDQTTDNDYQEAKEVDPFEQMGSTIELSDEDLPF